jgi:hypothetical protein
VWWKCPCQILPQRILRSRIIASRLFWLTFPFIARDTHWVEIRPRLKIAARLGEHISEAIGFNASGLAGKYGGAREHDLFPVFVDAIKRKADAPGGFGPVAPGDGHDIIVGA